MPAQPFAHEMMTDRSACHIFKQTRVNLDWTEKSHTSTFDIPLPHHAGWSNRSLSIRKRPKRHEHPDTEEKFKLSHHASTASIYYRPAARFPRCILWRVVEDSHVLSVAAVDFTKPDSHAELETTFRFVFPEPIQPGTVGFADAPGRDELVVYALTRDGVLYTLSLTPDFLLRNSFLKRGAHSSDYCTTYCPSAFTLHSPHFLLPISYESLVIPLQDGNILKLDRNHRSTTESPDPSIASYNEKTFSDTGYFGFLKNKMPWVGASTIQYGRGSVTHTTVVSATAYSPSTNQLNAKPLLFTVSVDHSLKVWSLEQECLVRATDLLNEPQNAPVKMKTWLDPSPSHLLAIIDRPIGSLSPDHSFYLVSFSSAATGKFKFWAATHFEDGPSEGQFKDLIDLYPEDTFNAMPPSATAPWIISEFRVTPAPAADKGWYDLWVLWKSDTNFQVQNVRFNVVDVRGTWGEWTTATSDTLHNLPRQSSSDETTEDVSEHWMNWVFYPGRFPDTVLESALRIYENNFLVPGAGGSSTEGIRAKVARIIGSAIQAAKTESGDIDYDKYRNETELQWDRFSRLCIELDKQRREALSLVSDPVSGFVWTVNVDGITALRECTETEVIRHNSTAYGNNLKTLSNRTDKRLGAGLEGQQLLDVMAIVSAATELSESLSGDALDTCKRILQETVVKDPMHSVSDTMWIFYEQCLEQEVPEETHEKIVDFFNNLHEPGVVFDLVTSSLFNHPYTQSGSARLTAFGAKVLVGGTQEVIHINYELLTQLVLLLIYVTFADNTRRLSMVTQHESVYIQLLQYFREYEVLSWMARTSAPGGSEDDISKALTDLRVSGDAPAPRQGQRPSVLQLVLPGNFGPSPPVPGRPASLSLSVCIRNFMACLDLWDHQRGNGITNVASALIHADPPEPATDFSKFLPATPWGTYVKARIQLKAHSYVLASKGFNRAAYGMSTYDRSSFSATSVFSAESGAVGCGLARYYLHIASLFEQEGAPEYVVDFCNAAIMAADAQIGPELMSDILVRYFKSALKVSLFDEAYMALARYTDGALRRSGVRDLVAALVEQNEGTRLCSYSWIGLQDEVDEALEFKCQQTLDVSTGPPFHKMLAAWRIQRGDYRGAAYILYEELKRLRTANVGSMDPNSRTVPDAYLALINVLSCVEEDQAWILSDTRADGSDGTADRSTKRTKLEGSRSTHQRQVLTLPDIKLEYQTEVERVGLLLNGGFFV